MVYWPPLHGNIRRFVVAIGFLISLSGNFLVWLHANDLSSSAFPIFTVLVCSLLFFLGEFGVAQRAPLRSIGTACIITNLRITVCEVRKYQAIDSTNAKILTAGFIITLLSTIFQLVLAYFPRNLSTVGSKLFSTLKTWHRLLSCVCGATMVAASIILWSTRNTCAALIVNLTADVALSGIGEGSLILLSHAFDDREGQDLVFFFASGFISVYAPIFDLLYEPCGTNCKVAVWLLYFSAIAFLAIQWLRAFLTQRKKVLLNAQELHGLTLLCLGSLLATGFAGSLCVWLHNQPGNGIFKERDQYLAAFALVFPILQLFGLFTRTTNLIQHMLLSLLTAAITDVFPRCFVVFGYHRAGLVITVVVMTLTVLAPPVIDHLSHSQNSQFGGDTVFTMANESPVVPVPLLKRVCIGVAGALLLVGSVQMFYNTMLTSVGVLWDYFWVQSSVGAVMGLFTLVGVICGSSNPRGMRYYGFVKMMVLCSGLEFPMFSPNITGALGQQYDAVFLGIFALFGAYIAFPANEGCVIDGSQWEESNAEFSVEVNARVTPMV